MRSQKTAHEPKAGINLYVRNDTHSAINLKWVFPMPDGNFSANIQSNLLHFISLLRQSVHNNPVKLSHSLLLTLPLWLAGGCQSVSGVVFQVSTPSHVEQGRVRASTTLSELKSFGDMGIGTFDRHDGELILINGDFYRITYNGDVKIPSASSSSPYAVVTKFEPNLDTSLPGPMTREQLERHLDKLIPNRNLFCVFYIRGNFRSMRARSQRASSGGSRPTPLQQRQSIFEFTDVYGTLVGIRAPEYLEAVNTPGYQFTFLNEERNGGGKVIDLFMTEGRIRADTRHERFQLVFPK